jgi:hypothetical protein
MTLNPFARIASLGWAAWLATLVATACLCAVLAYWFMQIAAPRAPIGPALSGPANRDRPDLTAAGSLFGTPPRAQAAAAPVLGNVQVLGVVAAGRLGSAILIVDGKPARSFAVGDSIGPGQTGAQRAPRQGGHRRQRPHGRSAGTRASPRPPCSPRASASRAARAIPP